MSEKYAAGTKIGGVDLSDMVLDASNRKKNATILKVLFCVVCFRPFLALFCFSVADF